MNVVQNEKIQNQKAPATDDSPSQESMYDGGARATASLGWNSTRAGDPDAGKVSGGSSNSGDVKAPMAAG